MVINLKMKKSCLEHGHKPTNDNPWLKTWL